LNPASCLTRLEKIKTVFDQATEKEKRQLLQTLSKKRLTTSKQVQRLHNVLCFIYAYPDSEQVFSLVNSILHNFAGRSDLRKHRKALVNSGISGCNIDYQFYWPMARWLATNWPEHLQLLWKESGSEHIDKLFNILPILLPSTESAIFDQYDHSPAEWLDSLKDKAETSATFYINRLSASFANDFERETIHDDINLVYRLTPGPGTPDIATTTYEPGQVIYQTAPLNFKRQELRTVIQKTAYTVQPLSASEGNVLVDLARKTMVTHERDLDAFSYGNPADVSLIDFRDGYQVACIGMIPERRYPIHATCGFLNLKNGIPVAYMLLSTAFNIAEVAFNLFTAFRGGEASHIYGRNLAIAHQYLGAHSFVVDPYQLGHDNKDGLRSGVWWFYYKLGFRPGDKEVLKLLRQELTKVKQRPAYRSPIPVLNKLASASMYFSINDNSDEHNNLASLSAVAPAISAYLSDRFGSGREKGLRVCAREAAEKVGCDLRQFNRDELRAWHHWAPLLLNLGRIEKWTLAERNDLVVVVRLKGQPREHDYLLMLNKHKRLKTAIFRFANRYMDTMK